MSMKNPPHPGRSIKDACLNPLELSITEGAKVLGVTRHTLSRVINGRSGISPDMAIRLEKAGWSRDQVDLFEFNEAFAVQQCALVRELEIDPAKVNVHGGAVAIGHPIGASGARILTTLLYAMADRGATRGVAALCLGGGNAVALAIRRI